MKKRKSIGTYALVLANSFFPPLLISLVFGAFVVEKPQSGNPMTFAEAYYPAIVAGVYLCAGFSVAYFLLIRRHSLKPHWWSNLILVLLGWLAVPLSIVVSGNHPITAEPMVKLGNHAFFLFIGLVIVFTLISLWTRKASNPASHGTLEDSRP